MALLRELIQPASLERCGDRSFPVLSMTMHDGIMLQSDRFKKSLASVDQSAYKVVRRNQLVVGFPIDEGVLYIQQVADAGIMSPAYDVWNVDETKVNLQYFELCLHSPQSMMFYRTNLRGTTARRRSLPKETLLSLPVPVPSMERQREIASTIARLKELIELRQCQLRTLDTLIKARFVEMFVGKGHPMIALDDLSLGKGEYGAQSASVAYDPKRPRYVRITDINDDGTLNDDVVSSATIEDDEQYRLTYGDFMFARMGATVGKTYAYKTGNQIFAGYLIRYRLNLSKITPEYLFAYTQLDEYKNWVVLNQSGAAQPGINAKKYGSLKIPVAPMDMQRAFQDFVSQVDKSKVVVQQALDKSQLLFDDLMQQYFV